MIVVNTETIAGHQIVQVKGIVQGNTVRAKHAGRDIAAGLKNLVGGELRGYTELLIQSDPHAGGFYQSAGAIDCGNTESASMPGRQLPGQGTGTASICCRRW